MRRKGTEREMQEYLLLNYPQDVRNNLKKLIKMPRDEEVKKSDNITEDGGRSKKKGNSQMGEKISSECRIAHVDNNQAWTDWLTYHPCPSNKSRN